MEVAGVETVQQLGFLSWTVLGLALAHAVGSRLAPDAVDQEGPSEAASSVTSPKSIVDPRWSVSRSRLAAQSAAVLSDGWAFALLSSVGAFCVVCALAEKLLVYHSVLQQGLGMERNATESATYDAGLALGVFVRSVAASTVVFDGAVVRQAPQTSLHVALQLAELAAFALLLWRFQTEVLSREARMHETLGSAAFAEPDFAGARDGLGQQHSALDSFHVLRHGEALMLQLLVCAGLACALTALPLVRFFACCEEAQRNEASALNEAWVDDDDDDDHHLAMFSSMPSVPSVPTQLHSLSSKELSKVPRASAATQAQSHALSQVAPRPPSRPVPVRIRVPKRAPPPPPSPAQPAMSSSQAPALALLSPAQSPALVDPPSSSAVPLRDDEEVEEVEDDEDDETVEAVEEAAQPERKAEPKVVRSLDVALGMGAQQQTDLYIGTGLCLTGVAMSMTILRSLKR